MTLALRSVLVEDHSEDDKQNTPGLFTVLQYFFFHSEPKPSVQLHEDAWFKIFTFLPAKDIVKIRLVSKLHAKVAMNELLWHDLVQTEFPLCKTNGNYLTYKFLTWVWQNRYPYDKDILSLAFKSVLLRAVPRIFFFQSFFSQMKFSHLYQPYFYLIHVLIVIVGDYYDRLAKKRAKVVSTPANQLKNSKLISQIANTVSTISWHFLTVTSLAFPLYKFFFDSSLVQQVQFICGVSYCLSYYFRISPRYRFLLLENPFPLLPGVLIVCRSAWWLLWIVDTLVKGLFGINTLLY